MQHVPILVLDRTAYIYSPAQSFQCQPANELQLVGICRVSAECGRELPRQRAGQAVRRDFRPRSHAISDERAHAPARQPESKPTRGERPMKSRPFGRIAAAGRCCWSWPPPPRPPARTAALHHLQGRHHLHCDRSRRLQRHGSGASGAAAAAPRRRRHDGPPRPRRPARTAPRRNARTALLEVQDPQRRLLEARRGRSVAGRLQVTGLLQ